MTIPFYDGIPAAPNNPSNDQPLMLLDNIAIVAGLGIDHRTFNEDNTGYHKSIHFDQITSYVPVPPVSPPQLFTDVVAGLAQLKYYSGTTAQTSDQYVLGAVNFSTMVLGGMILKGGVVNVTSDPQAFTYASLLVNAFPNATRAVLIFPANATARTPSGYVSAISATGFTLTNAWIAGTASYYFIAIGY